MCAIEQCCLGRSGLINAATNIRACGLRPIRVLFATWRARPLNYIRAKVRNHESSNCP
jgi:hypothetical protein